MYRITYIEHVTHPATGPYTMGPHTDRVMANSEAEARDKATRFYDHIGKTIEILKCVSTVN